MICEKMSSKRCPNFTTAEIFVLTDEVEKKRKLILLSKQNSSVSNSLKKDTWKDIGSKVNAVNASEYGKIRG